MTKYNAENIYLDRAKFVMKCLGVWLPPVKASLFSKLYRIFMVTLQYLFLLFQIIYVFQEWGDLEAVSQASYVLFTQACLCFKVTVFLMNSDSLRELLGKMTSEIFHPQNAAQEYILKNHSARIKRLLLTFMVSAQVTCGMWALQPLFDDTGSREFPFRMWADLSPMHNEYVTPEPMAVRGTPLEVLREYVFYGQTLQLDGKIFDCTGSGCTGQDSVNYFRMPVAKEKSPQYELGYLFQLLTICMSASMYFGVDSVTLSMIIFGCAQIEVIQKKILDVNNITARDRMLLRTHKRSYIFEENYAKLRNCIEQHQSVVTFIQLLEDTYHTYLLFQLSGSVGLICMSALRILVVDWRSVQFFSIVTYLSVMIMQMSICCWCGHELTATGEELFTTLSKCPWYEQEPRFRKDLLFTMMRMSRPITFRAGHYVPLSRQTFVAILRMSYSYFAVLQQTHK